MQNDIEQKFYQYQNNANSAWNYYYVAYTEWFPADVKPVHVGWYECELYDYLWWNGLFWSMRHDDSSMQYVDDPCVEQHRVWRGLCVPIKNIIN